MDAECATHVALVAYGNRLLRRHEALPRLLDLVAFSGCSSANFHAPDGAVYGSPNEWLEHMEEFHAHSLALVPFLVTDASGPIAAQFDDEGVWGIQVDARELWIAGRETTVRRPLAAPIWSVNFRGQPLASPISRVDDLKAAQRLLHRAIRSRTAPAFRRAISVLEGAPAPERGLFPSDHPEPACRLGAAAACLWGHLDPDEAAEPDLRRVVVRATMVAANA